MRKLAFITGEYYHIYNRGVEKRSIVNDEDDSLRFLQSMKEFNTIKPIGSIYEHSFLEEKAKESEKLVSFVAYCLNPNHYHFILTPKVDNGIQLFMHKFGTGYAMYYNNKHKRNGSLFQGKFKASHINSNEYLLHVSAYVNLNDHVHQLGGSASKLVHSSWDSYTDLQSQSKNQQNSENLDGIVLEKDIILEQFRSTSKYKTFAEESLASMIEQKSKNKELAGLFID